MISLTDVTVVFGRTIAIDSLTLTIERGLNGLFGPNGSGKSTLLRSIAGLVKPARGIIAIDGERADHRNEALRGRIGYCGHDSGLYGQLTLRENLELFATLTGADVGAVPRTIGSLKLDEYAGRRVSELSAGTTRRAALARAIIHNPSTLLLDEPYANVDDDAAELISEAIRAWATPDKIAVIATHGAKKVKAFATAGIVLQRGRLVRAGTYTDAGFTPR